MLTDCDEEWLRQHHPKLWLSDGRVSGTIEFEAIYDPDGRWFLILGDCVTDTVGGIRLGGQFAVTISKRSDTSLSKLPAVHVDGLEPSPDRHFNQRDKSACLCSPLQEDEYLSPEFSFPRFFERLVIPFLYGQLFFSREHRWPWPECEHGAVGLLESYLELGDPRKAADCLGYLEVGSGPWKEIRDALKRGTPLKGHMPCFCEKKDQIRRCHPRALQGIRQLQIDIAAQRIPIP